MLKPQGEGVKARFVMKRFNRWKDENNDFYRVFRLSRTLSGLCGPKNFI